MNDVVTLEPWSPWPLVFPALVLIAAVSASILGARRHLEPLREAGYVGVIIAGIAGGAMTWTMSAVWDTEQRQTALIGLGYTSPTFSGSADLSRGEVGLVGFQAVDGDERVRGVFKPLGGDRWEVALIDEGD